MEHRHFPRKPTDSSIQLITHDGRSYHARILEVSAVGMRVVINENLPERIKLVDAILPVSGNRNTKPTQRLPMLIVRKNEYELGLCLINEKEKIDLGLEQDNVVCFSTRKKIVNQS